MGFYNAVLKNCSLVNFPSATLSHTQKATLGTAQQREHLGCVLNSRARGGVND